MSGDAKDPVDQALDVLREHRDEYGFTEADDFVIACIGHLLGISYDPDREDPPQPLNACRVFLERQTPYPDNRPGHLPDAQVDAVVSIGHLLTALADVHDSASDRQSTALGYLFAYEDARRGLDAALTDYEKTLREEVLR